MKGSSFFVVIVYKKTPKTMYFCEKLPINSKNECGFIDAKQHSFAVFIHYISLLYQKSYFLAEYLRIFL